MHSIQYNEVRDEFTVPLPISQAIMTFRGDADGDAAPLRVIQGPSTQLGYLMRLAIDPVHNEIFVPMEGRVLVYPLLGNGDIAPIRILAGPDTGFHGTRWDGEPTNNLGVDPVHNLLVVVAGDRLLIFNRTDQGNVKPMRVIGGPKSGLTNPGGPIALYPPKGWIVLTNRIRGEGGRKELGKGFIGVWSIFDDGDVPPRWKIGGPGGPFMEPRGVTLNPKHKEIIATDKPLNAIFTFYFPAMF